MTFVGLGWADSGASDLHLLKDLVGPDLRLLLRAFDSTATGVLVKKLADMPGLAVSFTARLVGTSASHGAAVDPASGEVDVTTTALKGRSFTITASATQAGTTHTTRIRVTVHNALTRMWLTPGPRLTVRNGASGVRFSALALFDDGIIGDIGTWSPFEKSGAAHAYVHERGVNSPALTWSSAGPPVAVDPETGVLTASADAGQSVITARFRTTAPATATAVCARPWSTPTPLTHLGGPGVRSVNFVPNVLFLPDGFTDADQGAYEKLVRLVVKRLEYRNRTRPFAALLGRINYWRGWVASPQAGISVLNEVSTTGGVGTVNHVEGVPRPSESLPAANWKIADLVNAVGLPNVVADPLGGPIGPKITEWLGLYPSVTAPLVSRGPIRPGGPTLYAEWLALNSRALVDERDTALHMAFGRPPSIGDDSVDREIAPNPRRLIPDDFNTFLDALRGPANQVLGPLWTTGKDRNLVVVVCRSSRNGGATSSRPVRNGATSLFGKTIGLALADRPFHRTRLSTTGGGFELKPDDIPTDVFYSLWLTTAHELGHAAGLGDEYGGDTDPPSAAEIVGEAGRPNIQDRDSLLTGGNIIVDRIKWANWVRIAKAGLVRAVAAAPGTPAGPTRVPLTVTLDDVGRSGLRKGDVVRLRRRPLATSGAPSPRWRVDSVDAARGQVVIVPQFAGATEAIDPRAFPDGSVLVAPVRTPDPPGGLGAERTLTDIDVLTRIAVTNNPLNALPGDPVGRPTPNKELPTPTPATNFVAGDAAKPATFSPWTIGLYENGDGHNTGFYHPTGVCVMNADSKVDLNKGLFLYDMCLVCRYAFVDNIDPTLHGQVEQDFVERYGKRGAR